MSRLQRRKGTRETVPGNPMWVFDNEYSLWDKNLVPQAYSSSKGVVQGNKTGPSMEGNKSKTSRKLQEEGGGNFGSIFREI
jgi:hypothetical protein